MHRNLQPHPSSRRVLSATSVAVATAVAFASIVLGSATPARAQVSADINIRLGDRPAPVVVFREEPEVVLVPRSRVYYVEHRGYDLYRYGRYWYINDDGYWFRASSYRGPFVSLALRHVPRSITVVPDRYRRHPIHPHGGPPGLAKKYGNRGHDRDDYYVQNSKGGKGKKRKDD